DPRRQDQPGPVRDRAGRHALPVRYGSEHLRSGLHQRGFQLGVGQRRRSRPGAVRAGHRYRGLRPGARGVQQHRRPEAQPGVGETGLGPACRTLDCISFFALGVGDAAEVAGTAAGYDATDAYSRARPADAPVRFPRRPRMAVPADPEFLGDEVAAEHFARARDQLERMGATLVEIDFAPFAELGALLYHGPWVAERHVAIQGLLERNAEAIHPVVREVIGHGLRYGATDAFRAEYR